VQVQSMEVDATSGLPVDTHRVHQSQRRLAALTRQNRRLDKSTDKARRALRGLREREHGS
jgi:hypothetical protein